MHPTTGYYRLASIAWLTCATKPSATRWPAPPAGPAERGQPIQPPRASASGARPPRPSHAGPASTRPRPPGAPRY
jgi:hypothetical protein